MEGQNCNCGGGCGCEKMKEYAKNHPKCRKIFKLILLLIVLGAIISFFNCDRHYNKDSQINTIVVNGKGELSVKPDIATISFGVMVENMDVSKASDAVNTKVADIVAKLKADGIDDKDIKTSDYSISPRYNYTSSQVYPYNGTQVLAGYDVTQSFDVKIRDLSKTGKVVTDLGTLKVTNMSGLTFTEDKYDDLVKQARDQAIAQARVDAQSLAKSLGVRLTKIVGYSEGGTAPIYYAKTMNSAVSLSDATGAVLPTGENKITSNVSITYEIK